MRQTSMPPAGFEPTIPANEWSQVHALDRAATGNSSRSIIDIYIDLHKHNCFVIIVLHENGCLQPLHLEY